MKKRIFYCVQYLCTYMYVMKRHILMKKKTQAYINPIHKLITLMNKLEVTCSIDARVSNTDKILHVHVKFTPVLRLHLKY